MQEEKVVYSRSRPLHVSAPPDLESAFKAFMPQSKDFMSSETELWNFLCSLRHEFSPVILRSKDVYGYSSSRAVVPNPDTHRTCPARNTRSSRSSTAYSLNPPAKRKRGPSTWAPRKRRRAGRRGGSTGGSDELETSSTTSSSGGSGHSGRSSPTLAPPAPVYSHLGKSLEEIWKAATPRCPNSFPCVKVDDVSGAEDLAAARRQAQSLLQVNLEPEVRIRRFPLPWL